MNLFFCHKLTMSSRLLIASALFLIKHTVNSRYLDFGYLESPLISNRKFGPCFNIEIENQVQNIVEESRNCSWGAISPLFHNIFNIYF